MTLVVRHAAVSDIGLHRTTNEDSFVEAPPLYAVADGMGGAQAGEVASRLALEALVDDLAAGAPLRDAALAANAAVYAQARSDRAHSGMGTTLTAVSLRDDDRLEFAHVGDSRMYRMRGETLEQITDDHSLVGEMVREGHLTREAALTHPQRSILSRALGTEPRVEIDVGEVDLQAGDAVLLCSDGLYSMVSEATIAAVLHAVDDPVRAARQLVREAKNEGGYDNITVIVVRIDELVEAEQSPTASAAVADTDVAELADQTDTAVLGRGPEPAEPAGQTEQVPPVAPDASAAPPAAAPEAATPPPAAAAPRRSRRRLWIALVVVALLVALLIAGVVVAQSVYFVGADGGMVSVYHGLPWVIGGVHLYGTYLTTSYPVDAVPPDLRRRVQRHELHTRAAALLLARQAQGLP